MNRHISAETQLQRHRTFERESNNLVEGGMAESAVVSLVRTHSEMVADHILAGRVRVIE